MNEMEERVAKAICERLFGPFDEGELSAPTSPSSQAMLAAGDAIEAMGGPRMFVSKDLARELAVIDEALK